MQAPPAVDTHAMTSLAADFPGWHIWRSRTGSGRETGWNATRQGRVPALAGALRILATGDPLALRTALEQQEALRMASVA